MNVNKPLQTTQHQQPHKLHLPDNGATIWRHKLWHTWTYHATQQQHPFNGLLSGTTQVSRYQKGKTNLDFTEARDSGQQWHQPGHMQVCNSP